MNGTQAMKTDGDDKRFLALSGGVGGAKLVLGLSKRIQPENLVVGVNTGDDMVHLGLKICPDLDSIMYALSGLSDTHRGWGVSGESWAFMEALKRLGGEDWFNLGDQDLATHVLRTARLREGKTLTYVTQEIMARLGVHHTIVPMTNDVVRTVLISGERKIGFQDYFVREKCTPVLTQVLFEGAERAEIAPGLVEALNDPNLAGIILCPSNPFLSIDPILAVPGVRRHLRDAKVPVIAVSPIVAGDAVKGPTAKIMREYGLEVTPLSIAQYYEDFLTHFVIDAADSNLALDIEKTGLKVAVTRTLMSTIEEKERLAQVVLDEITGA